MLKKINLFSFVFIFLIHCTNFYSPTGIQGKQAKKQLEEHRSNLSLVSLSSVLTASLNAFSNSATSTYTCPTENTATLGFTSPTAAANFSLPTGTSYLDLSVPSNGTYYFRSYPAAAYASYTVKILKTETTSASASCKFTTNSVCGTADLSGSVVSSYVGFSLSVDAGSCLAFQCTSPAYIRFRRYSNETVSVSALESVISLIYTPSIFESISDIGDDTYYTMKSFRKCKNEIANYAVIETQYSRHLTSIMTEVSSCNKPSSAIQAAAVNPSLTASLQADACKLEPVNAFGY
ncbi:hypothetical protein JWG41_11450 [Leptospira sp. 201903075]|uniref:hypothetical protein n=1 Tax=Leptospira chreensis TaxID=2810035 RepID=UPI001966002A|nr:hypothetical protein [Leptospira chreensis]MBM9591066.1 hypothetical protein [Leptospira chreensis]